MFQVSSTFRELVCRSHDVYFRAEILSDGVVVRGDLLVLPGGQVTVDYNSATRRSLNATLLDPDGTLTPTSPLDTLTPYGNELRIWYGVGSFPPVLTPGTLADYEVPAQQEWVPVATCRLNKVSVSDDGSQQISVEGFDRSRTISRNLFTAPYIVAAGTNYVTAITAMVLDRLPGIDVDVPDGIDDTTPLIVIDPQSDPWAEITKMASTVGCDAFFDPTGTFIMNPVTDLSGAPIDWVYQEGADATVISVGRDMDDDPGYNGVVLSAESTTLPAPLRSEVWDDNPNSPTYYQGKYGRVPKFVTSPYPTTQSQCDAYAQAELVRSLGGTEGLSLAVVPHPLHEVGDVVYVQRASSHVDQTALVDSFTIPIGVTESMPVTLRRKREATQ